MVVIPHEPGALFHGVVIICGSLWRSGAGHVHETRTFQPARVEPLEGGAVAEPRGKAAMEVGDNAVKRQISDRQPVRSCHDRGISGYEGLVGKLVGYVEQDRCASAGHDDPSHVLLVAGRQVVIAPEMSSARKVGVHLLAKL